MEPTERARGLGGGAVLALWMVGAFAMIGACFAAAIFNWPGVGLCLIAAAVAFSGIANTIFGGR